MNATLFQDARKAFQALQVIDVKLGKLLGNADHLRAAGTGSIMYAFSLACRISLSGALMACLTVMLILTWSFGNPALNSMASFTYAFGLLLVAAALCRGSGRLYAIPIMIVAGGTAPVALAAGIWGIDGPTTFAALGPLVVLGLGIMGAMRMLTIIVTFIERGFVESPEAEATRDDQGMWTLKA